MEGAPAPAAPNSLTVILPESSLSTGLAALTPACAVVRLAVILELVRASLSLRRLALGSLLRALAGLDLVRVHVLDHWTLLFVGRTR